MTKKIFSALSYALIGAIVVLSVFSLTGTTSYAAGTGAVSIGSVSIAGENVVVTVSASDIPASGAVEAYSLAPL